MDAATATNELTAIDHHMSQAIFHLEHAEHLLCIAKDRDGANWCGLALDSLPERLHEHFHMCQFCGRAAETYSREDFRVRCDQCQGRGLGHGPDNE